jgi:hypothetical protein
VRSTALAGFFVFSEESSTMPHDANSIQERLERLERQNRFWRWTACVGILAAVGWLASGTRLQTVAAQQAAYAADDPGNPARLLEDLHQLGHKAIRMIGRSQELGSPVPNAPSTVGTWSMRLLGTDIYRASPREGPWTAEPEVYLSTAKGPPNAQRVQAFKEHLARMKEWEKRFEAMEKSGQVSDLDLMEFRARRLVAEIWLARELHKPSS